MSDFIRPKRKTFEEKINVIAKSISKPQVESLSVKAELVDIKSEPLDVDAIKTEPLDQTKSHYNLTFVIQFSLLIIIFSCLNKFNNKCLTVIFGKKNKKRGVLQHKNKLYIYIYKSTYHYINMNYK